MDTADPLRAWSVAWADADGKFVGRPQTVRAQWITMQQTGPAVVFLFQRTDADGRVVNVLTAPYERIHSVDLLDGEVNDGTPTAG